MSLLSFLNLYLLYFPLAECHWVKNTSKAVKIGIVKSGTPGFIIKRHEPYLFLHDSKRKNAAPPSGCNLVGTPRYDIISATNIFRGGVLGLNAKSGAGSWWSINDAVCNAIRLRVPRNTVPTLGCVPETLAVLLNPKACVGILLSYLQEISKGWYLVLSNPGSYLEKHCLRCIDYLETAASTLSRDVHASYLKLRNLGLTGVLKFGGNPVENVVRIIGLCYLVEWITKSHYLKVHYDLNPMEIFTKGQYYRLLTSLFLHNGVMHMLQNVRSLLALGSEAITLLGPKQVIVIYLVSGVVANYVSYVYHFAYRNGIPSDVYDMTRYVVHGVGQSGKSTHSLVETVLDRIRDKQSSMSFPLFLFRYLHTSLFHILSGGVRSLLPITPKQRQISTSSDFETSLQSYLKQKIPRRRGCGASSAIYGLMGAICAYHLRFGGKLERARVLDMITTSIAQNLMMLAGANVDHISHMTGFLTGLGLTYQM